MKPTEAKNKKLVRNATSTIIGLVAAMLILVVSFILPPLFLGGLEERITPLIDGAMEAVRSNDLERAEEYAADLGALLEESEATLQLFSNHRDILEMMRAAQNLEALAKQGDAAAYIEDLCGIRIWFEFICESSDINLSNLF